MTARDTVGSTTDQTIAGLPTKQGGYGSPAQAVALATLCLVLFLTFLDNTIVSAALADIQSSLHAGVTGLQWVINGYALAFASLMLAGGMLGDIYGRKKVTLAGVAIFCAGSVIAAVAPNIDVLTAGRVVMGVGAAASEPGTLSIIRHVYPDRGTRADALGLWAAVSGLALALGPVIGGTLDGIWDWRAIFWFNLVFGVVAFAMAGFFVPESADPEGRRVDLPGVVLAAAAIASLSFAVIQGEESGYRTWWIDLLFGLAVVCFVLFLIVERRSKSPMLDLKFFRRPAFAGSNFVAFATYFGTFSIFFFTALYVEVVGNTTPFQLAVDFVPMAVGMVVASALTGPWVARIGARIPMTLGCLLAGGGILATHSVLQPNSGFSTLGWVLPIAGVGFGMALVPVTTSALTVVPPNRSGMAASTTNTSRELGAVFGVAVLGSIVNSQLTGNLVARLRALHLPTSIQQLALSAVTHGGLTSSAASQAAHSSNSTVSKIATEVEQAAWAAFGSGLRLALLLSGLLILAGAVVAFFTIHVPGGETYEL
ncbi:MAG TPA: MFS transporter [Acidimicrobiales bacterium]|nr:MFS transporter [Acidimicrobiales bacterium]